MNRNCIAEIDGYHFVLTNNDVILHDGNTAQSVLDKMTRRWLFKNIDVNSIDKSNVEINALEQNATPKFLIIFSMNGHNQNLQQLKLTYATEDARDEDYEAIQEYVGVDLGDLPGGGVPA
jgi:hypothetical protein